MDVGQKELMYDTFRNHWIYNEMTGGVYKRIHFSNGYTLSITRGQGTQSGPDTCEVAVISMSGPSGHRVQNTNEVEGYVTMKRLHEIMEDVRYRDIEEEDDNAVGGLL